MPKYYLDAKLISSKSVVRYLGVFVDRHLNWNDHCKYVAAKATRSVNFLRHCLFTCPATVKSAIHINVSCGLLWSMPVQSGSSI